MHRGHLACSQRLVRRAWRRCDKPSNVGHKSEATERSSVACYVGDPQSSCAEAGGQSSTGRREVGRREQLLRVPFPTLEGCGYAKPDRPHHSKHVTDHTTSPPVL